MMMVMVAMTMNMLAKSEPIAPCYFIFGDSLVDNGNNNQLQSLARANYFPYGIDFALGPTGRFSNGRTTVDVIGNSKLTAFLSVSSVFFTCETNFVLFL